MNPHAKFGLSKYCSNRKRGSQWDLLQWQPEVPGNVVFINT